MTDCNLIQAAPNKWQCMNCDPWGARLLPVNAHRNCKGPPLAPVRNESEVNRVRAICYGDCEEWENGCRLAGSKCHRMANTQAAWTHGDCPKGKWGKRRHPWVTTQELVADTIEMAAKIPPDVTRIVGIPRSGMLPASILATWLHLPLYTVVNNKVILAGNGHRMGVDQPDTRNGRWLYVDDTVYGGCTLQRLREGGVPFDGHLVYGVYTRRPDACDLYSRVLPWPHLLEWNFINTSWIPSNAVDLDGFVCHNPPRDQEPLYVPRTKAVRAIITARPESQRAETEAWLKKWGAKYRALIMWQGSEEDRWKLDKIADYKAAACREVGAEVYAESEPDVADAMRARGVWVLCPRQGYLQ